MAFAETVPNIGNSARTLRSPISKVFPWHLFLSGAALLDFLCPPLLWNHHRKVSNKQGLILPFGMNIGAYGAELVRGGILVQSPKGPKESRVGPSK